MFYQKFYKKTVNIGPRALLYTTILIFSMFLSSTVPYSQLKFENKKNMNRNNRNYIKSFNSNFR